MAISLNSENSNSNSSPRISFSHDLPVTNSTQIQEEIDITRQDMSILSNQNPEFNFFPKNFLPENESYPADELFFNGVIIPIHMKHKLNSITSLKNKENEKEELNSSTNSTLLREESNNNDNNNNNSSSKSFWRFKRSSSLNNYVSKKSSSIWSMSLLFRSKSTGQSSSSNFNSKEIQKNCCLNNGNLSNNQSERFSGVFYQKKPPLKKNNSGSGLGFRNSAALNVPPPYITKGTSDLLGFNALFWNGSREKKNKK